VNSQHDLIAGSCLRSKSFHDIVSVQLLDYVHLLEDGYDNFLPWLPLVAPELQGGLEANPLQAFRTGRFHRIPIIIGSVMNETDAWIPKVLNDTIEVQLAPPNPPPPPPPPHTPQKTGVLFSFKTCQVELVTRAFFGSNSSSILEQYHESPPYVRFGTLLTDSLITCYVRHVARLISSVNPASVRLYTHMHAPSSRADPTNWNHFECSHGSMCHAGDNVFTFAS
jgi:carboxylesterase type B